MMCTAAAVLAALHTTELPPRGTVITVPIYVADRYTPVEQRTIRNCAKRFGVELRKADR